MNPPTAKSNNDNNFQSDADLLSAIASKQKEALSCVYDRYSGPLFGVIYSITGDKTLSEQLLIRCFQLLWESAAGFKPGLQRLLPWLAKIAGTLAKENRSSEIHERLKIVDESKDLIHLESEA